MDLSICVALEQIKIQTRFNTVVKRKVVVKGKAQEIVSAFKSCFHPLLAL